MELIGSVNEDLKIVIVFGVLAAVVSLALAFLSGLLGSGSSFSAGLLLAIGLGGLAFWTNAALHDEYNTVAAQNATLLSERYGVTVDPESVEMAVREPENPEIHPFAVSEDGKVRDLGVRIVGGDLFVYDYTGGDYAELDPVKK